MSDEAADTSSRIIDAPGATNFRDIGGYETTAGKRVKWGRVYRSDKLSKLTVAGAATVAKLGLGSVVDLRTVEERASDPSIWAARPGYVYESARQTLKPFVDAMLHDISSGSAVRASFAMLYSQMPNLYRDEYAAMLHRLATDQEPMLVHCNAGKDRTGIAVALLLSALGVPRKTVVADYALTARLLPRLVSAPVGGKMIDHFFELPADVRIALWDADPAYISTALDTIDRDHGSVSGYLIHALGVNDDELAAIRGSLLE